METRWDATRSREFPARAEEEEGVGASLMSRTGNRGMRSAGPRARAKVRTTTCPRTLFKPSICVLEIFNTYVCIISNHFS